MYHYNSWLDKENSLQHMTLRLLLNERIHKTDDIWRAINVGAKIMERTAQSASCVCCVFLSSCHCLAHSIVLRLSLLIPLSRLSRVCLTSVSPHSIVSLVLRLSHVCLSSFHCLACDEMGANVDGLGCFIQLRRSKCQGCVHV